MNTKTKNDGRLASSGDAEQQQKNCANHMVEELRCMGVALELAQKDAAAIVKIFENIRQQVATLPRFKGRSALAHKACVGFNCAVSLGANIRDEQYNQRRDYRIGSNRHHEKASQDVHS